MEKLHYLSLVSKVAQELENHYNITEKVVAEMVVDICKESKSVGEFKENLKENGVKFAPSFIENIFKVIRLMDNPPPKKIDNHSILPPPPQSGRNNSTEKPFSSNPRPPLLKPITDSFEKKHSSENRKSKQDPLQKKNSQFPSKTNGEVMINGIYQAVVTGVQPYGFFARLVSDLDGIRIRSEKPIEGLCHISEIREGERLSSRDISLHVGRGDKVYVKVIHAVKSGKRISLSMKEVDQKTGKDFFQRPLFRVGQKVNMEELMFNSSGRDNDKDERNDRRRNFYDEEEDDDQDGYDERRTRKRRRNNRRPKEEISEYELFNLQQLQFAGVIPKSMLNEMERGYEEHLNKMESSMEAPEVEYDIEINNIQPLFLKHQERRKDTTEEEEEEEENEKNDDEENDDDSRDNNNHLRHFFGANRIGMAPQGSMTRAAKEAQQLARERKELREKEKSGFLPRKEREKFDERNDDGGGGKDGKFPSFPKKKRGWSQDSSQMPEWRKHVMSGGFGKISEKSIEDQRKDLPIYKYRSNILESIKTNQLMIIVGETGSGKTTQIPQYLAEVGYNEGGLMIGVTQPRRVAAISVAKRVAQEVGCRIGQEVGYTIRFEDKTSPSTKLRYMTDGMLLREALNDPLLRKYRIIMLDEAHERQLHTDVLFGILKNVVKKRKDLKLIVTSATLDAKKFSAFFWKCPVFSIPGRTFPVTTLYAKQPETDYLEASLLTIMQIHLTEPPGDILLFLTGQEEIDTACERLFERMKSLGNDVPELIILPIYSALPGEIQSRIFEPTPEGSRKVVIATNIAETSITIDGIYYVVDPGFVKQNYFNPKTGIESLVVVPISQAQANQRKGRAGRTGPGKCFRLYTEDAYFKELLPTSVPEIQRTNMGNIVLILKAMGINDLLRFEFMDPPSSNQLINAMEQLYYLEALDDEGFLTSLGKRMAEFPLTPEMGKCLIMSERFDCSEEVLTIVSMLSTENIFYRPREKMDLADKKKRRFHQMEGDHLTLLAVYKAWSQQNYSNQWCFDNFVQSRSLRRAQEVRKQLLGIMDRMGLKVRSAGRKYSLIRKALTSGFFVHAAKRDHKEGYKTIVENTPVYIHPSSALFGRNPEWVIYHSLVMTSREYMREVLAIDAKWLVELAPKFFKKANPKVGSKRKRSERIEPLFDRRLENQDDWRISKRRRIR